MFTKLFWKDAVERAVKTFSQALLTVQGAGALDILHTDWVGSLSVAAGATVLSFLTSLASTKVGDSNSASLVGPVDPEANGI